MSKIMLLLFALLLALPNSLISREHNQDAIIGIWFTEGKKSKVKIYKKKGKYYGKIIWLKKPDDPFGNPKTDMRNPDESKRDRKILGLLILRDFEYDGDNEWDEGEIYNPEDGKKYSCVMTLSDDAKTLDVRGYVGISLFGKTTVWKKAE